MGLLDAFDYVFANTVFREPQAGGKFYPCHSKIREQGEFLLPFKIVVCCWIVGKYDERI